MKPRLLFINSITIFGGGEVWTVNTMQEFIKRGYNVSLVCKKNSEIIIQAKRTNAAIFDLNISGDLNPITIFQLIKILKSKKINVVLANTGKDLRLSGIAAKFCKNIKVIARQGIDYPLKNNFIYKFVYNKIASEIVANSEATKHTMLNSAQWLDIDKVKVIYNGIDPDLYSSSNTKDLREELGLTKDDFIIGFVGRLSVQKGIQYALDGFKIVSEKYDNAHLLICGDGELKSFVENFISHNALQKKIHLLGFRNDIPNIMRTIDVLLTPSLWEGFGIVLIEAMASQKVCIASRTSSIPEIISDGVNGFLIPPEDSNSIAEAVSKLITSPDLVKDFGANGLRIFKEKFTLDSMITNYERCF